MITPPRPPDLTPPSAVEYRLPDQDAYWCTSSVLARKAVPFSEDYGKLSRPALAIPLSVKDTIEKPFAPEYSVAGYAHTCSPIFSELPNEMEEIELDEDWVFRLKPVSRERMEVTISEVRNGSLKNLSLSPLEDSEY